MLNKVISLSGRKSSGKTECSKELIKKGYVLLNFADGLKELLCKLLNINSDTLEYLKNNNKFRYTLTETQLKKIAKDTGIGYIIVKKVLENKSRTIRELLQIIGTQLIRSCNPDWHLNKLKEKIKDNCNYCIADTRFMNERNFVINELKGSCYYIIRTGVCDISNHISERELNWTHFDNNIIINDSSKEKLLHSFNKLVTCGINEKENDSLTFLKSTLFMELTFKNAFLAGYIFNNEKIKLSLTPFVNENYKLWFPSNKKCPDIIEDIKDVNTRNTYYQIWLKGVFSYYN